MMLRHVYCLIDGGGKQQKDVSGEDGSVTFNRQAIDSITLVFEFCPEKKTVIGIPAKDHNYFEFRFEPWILDVNFENFRLIPDHEGLTGKHPLLDDTKTFHYEKARR
jgi:hypothetical protein